MMHARSSKMLILLALLPALAGLAPAAEPVSNTIPAVTEPSKRLELHFPLLGIVKEVLVKEGDAVTAGQILVQLDDDIEAQEMKRLQIEASSQARVEAAEADREVKRKVYERKKAAEGGFSPSEIEEAELDLTFRVKQVEVATIDLQSNRIEARKQELKVEKMKLRSPIDGVVERIALREGAVAGPDRDSPAAVVVRNDPCYVVVHELSTSQVARLSVGETMDVKYAEDAKWTPASIIFISPVADAASDTQLVRLEMPNPHGRATGLPVQVKLPAKLLPAGADKTASR